MRALAGKGSRLALLGLFPRLVERLGESDRQQKPEHAEQAGEVSHGRTVRAMATESKEFGTVGIEANYTLLGSAVGGSTRTAPVTP